jgi:TolB-like protein
MSDYPNKVRQVYQVPEVCEAEYKKLKEIPKVAILPFANNSSFGKADTTTSDTQASYNRASASAVGFTNGGIGVAHVEKGSSQSHTNTTKRTVDPKLDKAITSALEGKLADMGGADVYSRTDLDKVMQEQKFQQSGLVDENTMVQVGKLAGVKYIITGSIDSVTQKYEDYTGAAQAATNGGQQKQQDIGSMLFKAALNAGASAASGMKITTRVTFKVIDVETGKIVASVQKEETKNIGQIKNPTYDQVIGGIKDDIMEALDDAKEELSDFFGVKGYITQVRSDKEHKKYIAQINLGKKDKVKPGQTFKVYSFEENEDPVSGEVTCDKTTMNVELKVSDNQLQDKKAWTVADGEDAPNLRPGQVIKRNALKNSMF